MLLNKSRRTFWCLFAVCVFALSDTYVFQAYAQNPDGFPSSHSNTANPACWDGPRIYHEGLPKADLAKRVNLIQGPPGATTGEAIVSPNGGYRMWVRNPDTSKPGPWHAALIVDAERKTRPTLLIEDVAGPITPRWINEKLIFIRVTWGRIAFSDLILDAEKGELIYHERATDGQIAYQQFQTSCNGPCPCETTPQQVDSPANPEAAAPISPPGNSVASSDNSSRLMPKATPGKNVAIGLVLLPTAFGSPEQGGLQAADNPIPVPVYASPEAGAQKVAELGQPSDFVYQEYTYEGGAVVVYEQRPGWYRIGLGNSADTTRSAWISSKSTGGFMPVSRLLKTRLAYLNQHWDGYTWKSPTTYMRLGLSRLKRNRDTEAREEYSVNILDTQQVGDGLWLQVETLDRSPCTGGTPQIVDRGWIPAYAESGKLVAWYHSRGC